MGNLKITTDGNESLTYKDKSDMVLGNSDRLTAGNDAYVTAGAREDVVLGFLLTALLGGNTEVAWTRTFLDGTLTKVFGQKLTAGQVLQRMQTDETTVNAAYRRMSGSTATMDTARVEIDAEKSKLVTDTNKSMGLQQVRVIAAQVLSLAQCVHTVQDGFLNRFISEEIISQRTVISDTETRTAAICQEIV
jgi:hypothetical protein